MARTRDFKRLDRVAATVQRVLAGPVSARARAADAGLVTITQVVLAPDLRRARVHLSVFGGATAADAFVRDLAAHAAELQAVIAGELRVKHTPVLSFVLDDVLERADRIQRLLGPARQPADGE